MAASFGRIDSACRPERHTVATPSPNVTASPCRCCDPNLQSTHESTAHRSMSSGVPGFILYITSNLNTWTIKFRYLKCETIFGDFTFLPSASGIMNQLEFPPNQSKHLSSNFIMSHCCSASNHLLSKKHQLLISNSTFKNQTSLRAAVNIDADRAARREDASVPPSHPATSPPMVLE